MALILPTAEEAAAFVGHVRQNMVRENLPPPLIGPLRRQRGLRVGEDEVPIPVDRDPEFLGPMGPGPGISGAGDPSVDCFAALHGNVIQFNAEVATGVQFVGFTSLEIIRPFIINTIGHISTAARSANVVFTIEVVDNNDITTISGSIFPRPTIFTDLSTGQFIFPTTTFQMVFPNLRELESNLFVVLWVFNNTGATINVDVGVSITFL